MLHENMNISRLMVYARRVRSQELKEKVEMLRGLGLLMEAPQLIGFRYKISPNLRSGVQIKSLPISQDLVVIRCLTLNVRRERVLINQRRIQLVESVVKNTMVSALRGRIISLVVERVVTK